jgi:hypothetical protein
MVLMSIALATITARAADGSNAAMATAPVENEQMPASEIEALLATGGNADPVARDAARVHAIQRALGGDGRAAFVLGALFRSGQSHPARVTERDADSARSWFEKCLEAKDCPPMALASLAELELSEHNDEAALQWAQGLVLFNGAMDKKLGRQTRPGNDAYAASLLQRCTERFPRGKRGMAATVAFNRVKATHAEQLGRMLDDHAPDQPGGQVDHGAADQAKWASFFVKKAPQTTVMREPSEPVYALYLLRAAPAGGRAERVTLIEGLPRAQHLDDFAASLARLESKPYAVNDAIPRRYALVPMQFNDPRYGLEPAGK